MHSFLSCISPSYFTHVVYIHSTSCKSQTDQVYNIGKLICSVVTRHAGKQALAALEVTKAGLDEGSGNGATDNPVLCMKTTKTAVNGRSASTNYETTKIEGAVVYTVP